MRKTLEIISGKWAMLIIYQINERTIRYANLNGVWWELLIGQLKFLYDKGIVQKNAFPEILPKVEYTLTDKGKELLPVINQIIQFGIKHKI
ncbi:helix-turn-helix domain-containing protein [Chryseobacterium ginsenosidimutans]|uniref:winged helix-turn-helix transcriptional regulator n=1 Tax=Chryseobacterium ginsenosidimutans TaxID=687846 RepID=UPI0031DE36E9